MEQEYAAESKQVIRDWYRDTPQPYERYGSPESCS